MKDAVKKRIKIISIILVVIIGVPILLLAVWLGAMAAMFGPTYAYRIAAYGAPKIIDYKRIFPYRNIMNQAPAFNFAKAEQTLTLGKLTYSFAGKATQIDDFENYLVKTKTTSLIIIKDDQIRYEKYFNGYTRDSINRSFSVAKSFTSTLVGLAVEDGSIHSINDPIITYLPELKGRGLDKMTIRDLMLMNSGIPFTVNPTSIDLLEPFFDEAILYYIPDMRKHALEFKAGPDTIGAYFYYHDGYPQLEGIILERTTHKTPSAYLEEKIWKPLGMEYPATWSLYSEGDLEQMGGGINARSIDFAKFGRLFLNNGNWNGEQIVPADWVKEATSPDPSDNRPMKSDPAWKDMGGYYKYHWWGMHNQDGSYDYAALGHYGQIIYISPSRNAIVIHNGAEGDSEEWAMITRALVQSLK